MKFAHIMTFFYTAFLSGVLMAAELRFEVRHERVWKDHAGVLTVDDTGIGYQQALTEEQKKKQPETPPKIESVHFDYQDIQELWLSADKLVLVTYIDRKWFLGIDKEYKFFSVDERPLAEAYSMLKEKLDQRFVAALPDPEATPLWEIPVKLLGFIQGSEGILQVGPSRIVYKTERKGTSRTWRHQDIENISTSGPFQLTLTTFERSKIHYRSLKDFNFQLKQRLDEKQYDLLWKQLNRGKGLRFLTSAEESRIPR